MATDEPPPSSAVRSLGPKAITIHRVLQLFVGPSSEPLTQASIARATGLAPATVSGIVGALLRFDVLEDVDDHTQRGDVLAISPAAGYVVGVDVGTTHVSVAAADASGRYFSDPVRKTIELGKKRNVDFDAIAGFVDEQTQGLQGPRLALCIGLPAPIMAAQDPDPMLGGWRGSLQERLGEAFGSAVIAENDANLGALAEHRLGAAQAAASSIFVKASSGLGAGVVLRGVLWRGARGQAGEFGHLGVNEAGALCRCGNRGCLETELAAHHAAVLGKSRDPSPLPLPTEPEKRRAVDAAGYQLGRGLALLATAYDPEKVIIGGAWTRLGEHFLAPVRRGLDLNLMRTSALRPLETGVVSSDFEENSVIRGAIVAAADEAIDVLTIRQLRMPQGAERKSS